jgi:hypothetical protein
LVEKRSEQADPRRAALQFEQQRLQRLQFAKMPGEEGAAVLEQCRHRLGPRGLALRK